MHIHQGQCLDCRVLSLSSGSFFGRFVHQCVLQALLKHMQSAR